VSETGQPQIQIQDVAKLYGDHNVQALSGISLDIEHGEFIALMGASGCGKSTLLNIMGGIDRASSGSVLVNGDDLAQMDDDQLTRVRASKIGFIFQFFNLLSTLTVRENVALPLELLGKGKAVEIKNRVDQMLERVNIAKRADFYPAHLSGGELQRTAIARALIHSPQLILADEPTGNLDTENGIAILELLRTINREDGLTIVMACCR
jgi:putative ABC transport system ATP-binding protein